MLAAAFVAVCSPGTLHAQQVDVGQSTVPVAGTSVHMQGNVRFRHFGDPEPGAAAISGQQIHVPNRPTYPGTPYADSFPVPPLDGLVGVARQTTQPKTTWVSVRSKQRDERLDVRRRLCLIRSGNISWTGTGVDHGEDVI